MANVTVTSGGGGDVGQRGRGGRGGRGGVRVRGGRGRGRGRGGAGAIKVSTPGSYSMVVSKVFLFIFYARKTVNLPMMPTKNLLKKNFFGLLIFEGTVVHIHLFQRY